MAPGPITLGLRKEITAEVHGTEDGYRMMVCKHKEEAMSQQGLRLHHAGYGLTSLHEVLLLKVPAMPQAGDKELQQMSLLIGTPDHCCLCFPGN